MHYVPIHLCKYQYYEINIIKWNLKENCYWNITLKEVILGRRKFHEISKVFCAIFEQKILKDKCQKNSEIKLSPEFKVRENCKWGKVFEKCFALPLANQ